jgi:alkylation response protein AidB-like acyl-CoA dehydrogenase
MLCNIPSCLASTAVGAASGALDEYLARTSRRITRGAVVGSNKRMAEFPAIQLRVAEAAASTDAARALLLRDLQARSAPVRAGRPVSVEERTGVRGQPRHSRGGSIERLDRR